MFFLGDLSLLGEKNFEFFFIQVVEILYNKNNNSYETVAVKLMKLYIGEFRMLSYRDTV